MAEKWQALWVTDILGDAAAIMAIVSERIKRAGL